MSEEQKEKLALGHSGGDVVPNWDFQDALAGGGAFKSTVSEMLSFLFWQFDLDENDRTNATELTQELQAEVERKMGSSSEGATAWPLKV